MATKQPTGDPPNPNSVVPVQQGWKCPACGAGNAPWNKTCPCVSITPIVKPCIPHDPWEYPTTPYIPMYPPYYPYIGRDPYPNKEWVFD